MIVKSPITSLQVCKVTCLFVQKIIIINTFLSVFVLLLSALSLKKIIKLSSLKAL